MKKSLFAVFLAVMLVAALVFVITPDAKAADNLITAQADNEVITVSAADTVLDLNGKKNVVVKIDGGVELSVIDTSFILDKDTLDLTGKSAGTLTVDPASSGTIASVALYGDFRYLAVEEGGTYAFHPFNLAISKLGINTISESVCIRVSFIANDVVRAKLSDYGIKGVSGDATAYSAKENYKFGNKNGIQAYFDLKGSFDADKLDTTCSYQAYMVVDGVDVLSNYIAEITPRAVLKAINSSNLTPTATQKAAIETIAANNAHLADLFTSITGTSCTHNATIAATCQKASVCKNCNATIGTTVDHKDSDDANTECDMCSKELSDYVELDASELVNRINKDAHLYTKQEGTIFGRDNIYGSTFLSNWTVEVVAKTTVPKALYSDSAFNWWTDVRNNYKTKGYQYVAIDFALSSGASITAVGCLPPELAGGDIATSGPVFTAGKSLSWGSTCKTEEQRSYFAIYSNGKEVKESDTINAGQWYTVVIKLLVNAGEYGQGESGWSNVAFSGGNGNMVYFSGVRYYTNDTYKDDYIFEIPDYDEKDATELVSYKSGTTDAYTNQGTIFGRDNVYGANFSSWSVEVVAKTTAANSSMPAANSGFADWTAVRNNYKAQGYQYATIDFALAEGAKIRAIGCVPPDAAGGNVVPTGLEFTAGGKLAWASTCKTDEQKSYFAVYSEGKEVKVGDPINAGQWYTVVIKLLVDGNQYGQGEQGWASVAFSVGNGEMVYFSNVRYYRNDSYKDDYIIEIPDYDEKDATELVVYKSQDSSKNEVENYDRNNITIYERDNVYGVTFSKNSWDFKLAPKSTVSKALYANSAFADWDAVRSYYTESGYQYIAIDFALSAGCSINVAGSVPLANTYATAYLTFADNTALAWRKADYTDAQKACFTVYSEGKEVQVGDKIYAGQWYTVVVKLLTVVDTSSRYSNVGFELGNGKEVYFSGVRYYRNDSFTTDFAG